MEQQVEYDILIKYRTENSFRIIGAVRVLGGHWKDMAVIEVVENIIVPRLKKIEF